MRILFVTATRIGDAVLSTGLLSHLIARFPEARLTVAAGPAAAPLFAAVPGLERLITVHKRRWAAHWPALYARIDARIDDWVGRGLIDEVAGDDHDPRRMHTSTSATRSSSSLRVAFARPFTPIAEMVIEAQATPHTSASCKPPG